MIIEFEKAVQADGLQERLNPLKQKLEERTNLKEYPENVRPRNLTLNTIMRISLLAALSLGDKPSLDNLEAMTFDSRQKFSPGFFTLNKFKPLFSALLKLKYKDTAVDWPVTSNISRILNTEIIRGAQYLMQEGVLDTWLMSSSAANFKTDTNIPELDLVIGKYEDDLEAKLDVNSRSISNTQILIAGTTGSGKSNLLAVLMHQLRSLSADTLYPVNFLFFDYKGEFSDPANANWLSYFETDQGAILRPIEKPLPFTPFKDFSKNQNINELNLYSTSISKALCSIDQAKISANMNERLSSAIIDAYKQTGFKPVTFQKILDNYTSKLSDRDQKNGDSVTSVLKELIRANLFAETDEINLIDNCYIIDLGRYPKDGAIAKAIVYFVISKLNIIYENLPKQNMSDERVEIRHFTIIDEAHYMLGFENKPLQQLIAVGRNKGMSIILATQSMESFKSPHFDFYANAQYPLIMKQQSISDGIIKDLFGVSGKDFQELKENISSLQKGELILRDDTAALLGIGKKWKKIKVNRLI